MKPVVLADQPYTDPNQYSSTSTGALPATAALDQAAVTHHTITLNGNVVNYTATAGHLTANAPSTDPSKPTDKEVSFFYVAYTRDNQPVGTRPVTFFWNGGPGSSTIWLHLGSWGPKTFDVDEASLTPDQLKTRPTSFPMIDNNVSMLDDTDLVFVDAPGTGYSEAVAPHTNQDFWGVDQDTKVFRDFINRYISVNGRQTSPKYLYGESYGGIRTPIVADLLVQQGSPGQGGPALTGVILNSPILSYKTNCDTSWNVSCEGYIPTYAAVGYSKEVATDALAATAALPDYINQIRLFVSQVWAPALVSYTQEMSGNSAPTSTSAFPQDQQTLFGQMAGKTGITMDNWAFDFNMPPSDFQSFMLTRLGLGDNSSHMDRYNGMVTIPTTAGYDAQNYNDDAFQNEIKQFLPNFLKYTNQQSGYALSSGGGSGNWDWTHGTDQSNNPTSLPDLTDALTLDPKLKVVVFHGYHDLACPLHQSELDLGGAGLTATVPVKAFPGGHMIYLTKDSRQPMKQAIDSFFAQSLSVAAR